MAMTIPNNQSIADMAGLQEQIKGNPQHHPDPRATNTDIIIANITVMNITSLSNPQIIISKPKDDTKFTAWILDDGRKPQMRGSHSATPGEALKSLLQVTAEMVGERFFREFEGFEESEGGGDVNSNGRVDRGVSRLSNSSNGSMSTNGNSDSTSPASTREQNRGSGYVIQQHGWSMPDSAQNQDQGLTAYAVERRYNKTGAISARDGDLITFESDYHAQDSGRLACVVEEQHLWNEPSDVPRVETESNSSTDGTEDDVRTPHDEESSSNPPQFLMATGLRTARSTLNSSSQPQSLYDRRKAMRDVIGKSRSFSSDHGHLYILDVNESCGLAPMSPVKWMAG